MSSTPDSELPFGLPLIEAAADFARWRADPARWLPVVRAIAREENIAANVVAPFSTGTNLVVDLDGRAILKLFPPIYRPQSVSERASLRQLAGRLSVPIPALLGEGGAVGWSWLILSKLEGTIGSEAWPTLAEADKLRILEQIGRTIREVQAAPLGDLAAIEPAWPDFVARQIAGCEARHRRHGLAPHLLDDLRELLADATAVVPVNAPPVILTGEWIPENLLLAETKSGWRLAAVIDFGDVLTGWREYDLLGPSTYMCGGLPARVARFFAGYGLAPGDCDSAMRRRLLTLTMLHRASDHRNFRIDGWRQRVRRLTDLENVVWPV